MKLDPRVLIAPLVGLVVLVLLVQATTQALHASGTWQSEQRPRIPPESPYARLDAILAVPETVPADVPPLVLVRDPFGYGALTPVVSAHPERRPHRPAPVPVVPSPAPEPEQPTLTAIIWDEDPRATVRWNGRDFSVRQNSLFDDFVVKRIGPDQVVLERSGQELVLRLIKKGE